jgi:hypothetical protein
MAGDPFAIDDIVGMMAPLEAPIGLRRGVVTVVDPANKRIRVSLPGGGSVIAYLTAGATPLNDSKVWLMKIGSTFLAWDHDINTWTNASLQNGWANYGGGWEAAQYRMTCDGTVMLRGLVTGGTHGATIFTLPIGYRPINNVLVATIQGNVLGRLNVMSSGTVLDEAAIGNNGFTSLNISFSIYP